MAATKTVGIIGGLGPESTIDYYKLIVSGYRARKPDAGYPSILINSVDLHKLLSWMAAGDLKSVADYLVQEIDRLSRAGADFALLSANTPHIVFDEIRPRVSIPLISIVEATCDAAKDLGLKKVGLFGTRYTMQAPFYPDVFSRNGIALVVPNSEEQAYIHEKYLGELVNGVFLPETRSELLRILEAMRVGDGIEGLILGGTELPLILRDAPDCGIPFLDTTRIHVDRVLKELGA
jgi:aspartate racemase